MSLRVHDLAARTALGASDTAFAAARARLSRPAPLGLEVEDPLGEPTELAGHPIVGAYGFAGLGRRVALARPALDEVLARLPASASAQRVGLVVAGPGVGGLSRPLSEAWRFHVVMDLGVAADPEDPSGPLARGDAAFVQALDEAQALLAPATCPTRFVVWRRASGRRSRNAAGDSRERHERRGGERMTNLKVWVNVKEWDRWARLVRNLDFAKQDWRVADGEPATGFVPDDLTFDVDPQFGVEFGDVLPNTFNARVMSARMADAISALGVRLERFPVRIRNARGRVVPEPYALVNLLDLVPCADVPRCEYVPSLVPGEMSAVTKLVLDDARVDPQRPMFRIAEAPPMILVRADVAAAFEREGFTACRFVDVADFGR